MTNTENLPVLVEGVPHGTHCYLCGKPIKRWEVAVKYWWVAKNKRYEHSRCRNAGVITKKIKKNEKAFKSRKKNY